MSLYDRNYNVAGASIDSTSSENGLRTFVKQTYQLFAASMLAGTVGAYTGMNMAASISSFYWGFVILEIALLIGLHFVKDKPALGLMFLFGFTFVTGLTLSPLLSTVLAVPGGAGIVTNAFFMTSVAFGWLSLFAMNTKHDFSALGQILFITLIVVFVAGIINIFLGSPILQLVIAGIAAVLFSFYILYDTQNIVKGRMDSPILGAVALYLDFFNLFVSLLQILLAFTGRDE